jgi:hypothetical protein
MGARGRGPRKQPPPPLSPLPSTPTQADGRLRSEIASHARLLTCMDVHPTKDLLVTGGEDAVVNVWTLPIGGQRVGGGGTPHNGGGTPLRDTPAGHPTVSGCGQRVGGWAVGGWAWGWEVFNCFQPSKPPTTVDQPPRLASASARACRA